MAYDLSIETSASYNASGLYSYSFSGGRVSVAAPLPSATTFTVRASVKRASSSATMVAVGQGPAFWMGTIGHNASATYGSVTISTSTVIDDGNWHELQLSLDASAGGVFSVDGTIVGTSATTPASAGVSNTGNFAVRDFSGGGFPWGGEIDEVAIFNAALSGTYTPAVISNSATNIWALWHLDNDLLDTAAPGAGGSSIAAIANYYRMMRSG